MERHSHVQEVRLTAEERDVCHETIRRLKGSSERVRCAQILLKADADGPAWTDRKEAFSCRRQTVENIRRSFVEGGRALERKRRETPPAPKTLDGEAEARVIAVSGAAGARQLVVAAAGREGGGTGNRHCPRSPRPGVG